MHWKLRHGLVALGQGLEVGYSSALLTALDCGMDDLAALLHLHGAKLPPAEPRRPARPESALF
ncbi:hypothetical protein HaLaN_10991 [Haematococcus lacustris]|uniref:Uncharacterized protein n=1 Tax=Haematococcus lacustris TaxID=44745 RepID=A0A699YX89_HAELA|nr:hypothetical protein HaLaN_10991 [Haematococcus lacustris]